MKGLFLVIWMILKSLLFISLILVILQNTNVLFLPEWSLFQDYSRYEKIPRDKSKTVLCFFSVVKIGISINDSICDKTTNDDQKAS